MLATYRRLLGENRNFRLLWIAQVVSETGDWFYAVAVYSLLLELTGNRAQSVGAAVVLQVLPQTFIAPTAGALNDRLSRRGIMIAADVARFLIVLGMLLVRTPGTVWLAYPLLLLETIGAGFFAPAHSAVIPNIVTEDEVLAANTLASITWSFCLAAGASLGGVVAVLLGRDAVFVLNALSFLASGWLIRRMVFCEPHTEGLPPLRARELFDFRPVIEGFRYIGRDRQLLCTVFVKCGIGFLGANNVLLPVFGQRVFPVRIAGIDPQRGVMLGMSVLMGSRGAGALLGPLVGGRWAGSRYGRLRTGILAGFLCGSAGYLWLGRAPSLALAAAGLIVAHGGVSTNWVFSSTLLQLHTEDRFRGRVFAAELGLLMITISVSSYVAGTALDLGIAPRTFATGMGVVMLIPAAAWAAALRLTPAARQAPHHPSDVNAGQ
jgi:MFS family permease